MSEAKRRLAAILEADLVGFEGLVKRDETGTRAAVKECRAIFGAAAARRGRRVVDDAGDSVLAVFDSVVEAVHSAIETQEQLTNYNTDRSEGRRLLYRMGVAVGDIVEEPDGRVFGTGVIVAARLESIAAPGGIMISDDAYRQVHDKISIGFEDAGEHKVKTETVRGFRVLTNGAPEAALTRSRRPKRLITSGALFAIGVALVAVLYFGGAFDSPNSSDPTTAESTNDPEGFGSSFPDKASVAVLPFDNLSANSEHDYIAGGLQENIISTLSQARRLYVPPRQATEPFENGESTIADIARTLGVEHVLNGSVQVAGERVRVTMQLTEAATDGNIWTERYDRPLKDIFALQDDITLHVVNALQVQLVSGDQALRWRGGTQNVEAWTLVERAVPLIQTFTIDNNKEAQNLLTLAIGLDPDYALAWVYMGFAKLHHYEFGWTKDTAAIDDAETRAREALRLDPELPYAHTLMGWISFYREHLDEAIEWVERALALDPNGSNTRAVLSSFVAADGNAVSAERALNLIDEAMMLSPVYPDWYLWERGRPLFVLGRYQEAADAFTEYFRRIAKSPGFPLAAVALSRAGRREAALALIEKQTEEIPDFSLDYVRANKIWTFVNASALEAILPDLRALGVPEHPPNAAADRPSIAVLQFESLSDDPDQTYFAIGLTEDITTRLSRFSEFLVFARNSTRPFIDQVVDVREIGQQLGARYIVEGTVRTGANSIRVTVQLLDASDGSHLWAQIYDRDLSSANLFAIQDEITERIAGTIADSNGIVMRSRLATIREKPTESLEAYECVVKAIAHYDVFTPESHADARACLERAVELDANYAAAWTMLAYMYFDEYTIEFNPRPDPVERAFGAAQTAVRLDSDNEMARSVLSEIYFYRHELDLFYSEAERAIALNPNNSWVLASAGMMMVFAGKLDRGFILMNKAIALNPNYPDWYNFPLAAYHYEKREYEKALDVALRINMPDYWGPYYWRTIAFAQLGREEDARAAAKRLLELFPTFANEAQNYFRRFNRPEAAIEHTIEGLRKAGIDVAGEQDAAN